MSITKCFHIIDLKLNLDSPDMNSNSTNVGSLIGINDKASGWKLTLYLGNQLLLILFEKGKGVINDNFQKLKQIKPLEKSSLIRETDDASANFDPKWLIDMNGVKSENPSQWDQVEFFLYNVNLFETSLNNNVKPDEFLETIRFNLAHIEHLEEGDIVAFDRGWYQHHAVLTGSLKVDILLT